MSQDTIPCAFGARKAHSRKRPTRPVSVRGFVRCGVRGLFGGCPEVCTPFHVWGLTPLTHLWLLAADDWRSPWLVCITAMPNEGYRIQYQTVDADASSTEATVQGVASDEATACRIVLSAMRHSGGWNSAFTDNRDRQ